MSVTPAPSAASIIAAGFVFGTAMRRTDAGSRPTRSHAACSFAMLAPASSGAPHVFHSSACAAVMRSIRGLDVPTRVGRGDRTGLGALGGAGVV